MPTAANTQHADFILVPVHNRREITLGLLRALAADGVFDWATVVVLEDGSTDGTAAAIQDGFPMAEVLHGDGHWWWAGAIRRGMEWALARHAERIVWLNDDCRPPPGALRALCQLVRRENCVAWIDARTPTGWTYGAHRKTARRIRRCTPEEERAGIIDTFSGNCVALPRTWIERVGLPDDVAFPHGLADLDYGLRLKKAGARLCALPGCTAESAEPAASATESWLASTRPMRSIWRDFSSPKSFFFFPAWRRFCLRHWGPLWGLVLFAEPYFRWLAIASLRAIAPGRARAIAARRAAR